MRHARMLDCAEVTDHSANTPPTLNRRRRAVKHARARARAHARTHETNAHTAETRLGGVAHNGFSMAMMLVTTEEYGDQENGEHFFLDIIETRKNTIVLKRLLYKVRLLHDYLLHKEISSK